ncbi:MAG: hypothetical protein AAFY09_13915 [Pseudomonadota bacterium]
MSQRRVRTPNRATAKTKPIERPDTYKRLPEDVRLITCEQQPVHTSGSKRPIAAQNTQSGGYPANEASLEIR